MTKSHILIRESYRSQYLVDKIDFNLTLFFNSLSTHSGLNKNYSSFRFMRSRMFINKHSNKCYKVKAFTALNGNLILRELLEYNISLPKAFSQYSHRDNFIPYNHLRFIQKHHKITHNELHILLVNFLWGRVHLYREKLTNEILKKFDFLEPSGHIISLRSIEINWDIHTPPNIFLTGHKPLIDAIKSRLESYEKFKYLDNSGNRSLVSGSIENDGIKRAINGRYSDGSSLKVYTKEISNNAVKNRIERSFKGYTVLKKYLKTTIHNPNDLCQKIEKLSRITFEDLVQTSSIPFSITSNQSYGIIKEQCRTLFRHNYEEAFQLLTSNSFQIITGKNSNCTRSVENKTRELARKGILIRKTKSSHYCISAEYLNQLTCIKN